MRLLFLCAFIVVGQICISIFIMSPDYTREQIALEYQSVQSEFGGELALKVIQRANAWWGYFKLRSVIDKGPFLSINKKLNRLEKMRVDAYRYPENYQFSLYLLLLRFALLSFWLPVLFSIFIIFVLEGVWQRDKRKLKFSYSTVERNRLAFRFLATLLVAISVLGFSVKAIPALTLLVLGLVLAFSAMFVIASSKRSL